MNDLANDSVSKLLFRLSVPAILAQLINALYNMVDRMYIGHIEGYGDMALTGVGVTFPIIMIISAFAALVGMSGAPLSSIKTGEGDREGADKILSNCFVSLLGISVVLTAVFLLTQKQLLLAFGASENTIGYATDYLSIYLCGTIFVQISLGMNAFITSQGFAKTGMLTVLIGAILNILLDPILIFGFGMGVKGAAVATVISQAVSAIWVLCFLFGKKTKLKIRRKFLKIDPRLMGSVLALGLSPFVMQATESLVVVVLNSTLKKYGGDLAVGSMTVITSVSQFALMPLTGLTQGAQPIISFNYGAKKPDRVRKAFRLLFISCVSFSTAMWLAALLMPQIFVVIFTDKPALIQMASHYMRIFMGGVFMMGAQIACQQTFIALGQAKVSLFLALLRKVVLLIPLVYLLSAFFQTTGVFAAQPIADILAATTTVSIFAYKFKRIMKKIEE